MDRKYSYYCIGRKAPGLEANQILEAVEMLKKQTCVSREKRYGSSLSFFFSIPILKELQ